MWNAYIRPLSFSDKPGAADRRRREQKIVWERKICKQNNSLKKKAALSQK
jgi:hypothetical protein